MSSTPYRNEMDYFACSVLLPPSRLFIFTLGEELSHDRQKTSIITFNKRNNRSRNFLINGLITMNFDTKIVA